MIADAAYLRESILRPQAQVTAGYQPIMPTYQGLIGEDQVLELIAYIESLGYGPTTPASEPDEEEEENPMRLAAGVREPQRARSAE